MAAANSPEAQGRRDAHELKKSGADHSQALEHIANQASSMSSADLKTEQKYWNSLGKASHDSLPGLTIHRNKEGNVDSVVQKGEGQNEGKVLFNREAEVQKTAENFTGKLKNGQGPFQAFKEAGMSDREASQHAKAVMEGTGRTSFKSGEKLGVHNDGSVSTTSEHNGVSTQEKFNKDKSHETKVTQSNGDSVTTFKNPQGEATKTVEHKSVNGKSTDTTYDGDGASKKVKESTVTENGVSTTTKFGDNGKTSERTVVQANGESTTTKFQDNGATPTEKTVTKDGKSMTTKYAEDGIRRTETVEKGTDGLSTTTKFDTNGQKSSEHKEKTNGFTDTQYTNGKEVQKIDHTNGPNQSYSEVVTTAKTPRGDDARTSTRERGETQADGKFTYKQVDHSPQGTTTYDMTFDKGGLTGVGHRTTQGSGRNPGLHTIDQYYYNGQYNTKAPPAKAA